MSRVRAGVVTRRRHKKVLKRAKGYYGRRKNTFKVANQAVEKAGQYAYRDRKVKKRQFRSLLDPKNKMLVVGYMVLNIPLYRWSKKNQPTLK